VTLVGAEPTARPTG